MQEYVINQKTRTVLLQSQIIYYENIYFGHLRNKVSSILIHLGNLKYMCVENLSIDKDFHGICNHPIITFTKFADTCEINSINAYNSLLHGKMPVRAEICEILDECVQEYYYELNFINMYPKPGFMRIMSGSGPG